jgi:hypothetical protein
MNTHIKRMALLCLVATALSVWSAPVALPGEAGETAACPYCRAPRGDDEFCARCGRLAWTSSTPGAVRFWGDVFYVIPFPPVNAAPVITAELSEQGLVKETVAFPTGDRFTLTVKKGNARVEGRLGMGGGSSESEMEATIQDTFDANRLIGREILGSISGAIDSHIYRKLEYAYAADGRLASIRFTSSSYVNSSDWKKKPAAWQRHARGEIPDRPAIPAGRTGIRRPDRDSGGNRPRRGRLHGTHRHVEGGQSMNAQRRVLLLAAAGLLLVAALILVPGIVQAQKVQEDYKDKFNIAEGSGGVAIAVSQDGKYVYVAGPQGVIVSDDFGKTGTWVQTVRLK